MAVAERGPSAHHLSMFVFFSNRLGCAGSIAVSVVLTLVLFAVMRGCNTAY